MWIWDSTFDQTWISSPQRTRRTQRNYRLGIKRIKSSAFCGESSLFFARIRVYPHFNQPSSDVPPHAESTPLPGVVLCLSQKGTLLSPVSCIVLHVHVSLLHMHMSYCPTCACRTALHVHLKQRYTPRLHTLLYKRGLYQYRRKRWIVMADNI